MIQDIAPMQLDNSYKKKVPHAGSRMFGFGERTVYLEYNGELQFLTYEQWKDYNENILGREVPSCIYLFSIGEEEYFLTEIGADTKIGEFRFYKMFDVRPMQPKERVLAAATAWHLFVWYRQMWEKTGSQRNAADAAVSVLREHGVSEDRTGSHRGSHARR